LPGAAERPAIFARTDADVADPIDSLMVSALACAAAEPRGKPLLSGKSGEGFFPATAAGKTAARRACDAGWFAFGSDGKTAVITAQGLDQLIARQNPKPILDDFVRVLEAREKQVTHVLTTCREMVDQLAALRRVVEAVLPKVTVQRTVTNRAFPVAETWESPRGVQTAVRVGVTESILSQLSSYAATVGEDCPLPLLFRDLPEPTTVGGFHDALRTLHAQGRIRLHPWTGPLYQLPEPGLSLLVGHEVAYYASLIC
jgi:hypothetical protein